MPPPYIEIILGSWDTSQTTTERDWQSDVTPWSSANLNYDYNY